jgi:hypothetical protein
MTDVLTTIWDWIIRLWQWLVIAIVGVMSSSLFVYLLKQSKIPKLRYDGFGTKQNESGWKNEVRYFIKVSREGGEGEAKGVTGHVGIKNKLELKEGAWLHEHLRSVNIITYKYLVLFVTLEHKGKTIITFQGVHYKQPNEPDFEQQLADCSYENYKEDELVIEIYSSRGRIKKNRMEKRIKDIVKEARPIPP